MSGARVDGASSPGSRSRRSSPSIARSGRNPVAAATLCTAWIRCSPAGVEPAIVTVSAPPSMVTAVAAKDGTSSIAPEAIRERRSVPSRPRVGHLAARHPRQACGVGRPDRPHDAGAGPSAASWARLSSVLAAECPMPTTSVVRPAKRERSRPRTSGSGPTKKPASAAAPSPRAWRPEPPSGFGWPGSGGVDDGAGEQVLLLPVRALDADQERALLPAEAAGLVETQPGHGDHWGTCADRTVAQVGTESRRQGSWYPSTTSARGGTSPVGRSSRWARAASRRWRRRCTARG